MEDIIPLLQVSSFAPVAALFIWFVLKPLTALTVARMNGTDTSAQARLQKIETNDLHDLPQFKEMVARRLGSIEDQVKDFSNFQKVCLDAQVEAIKQFSKVGERLAVLETLVKK